MLSGRPTTNVGDQRFEAVGHEENPVTLRAKFARPDHRLTFDQFYRSSIQTIESAALVATDRGRKQAISRLRREMAAAGLGRLGNATSSSSDLEKARGVHRRGADSFSASGSVFVRSGSPRSRGALDAYTDGASISPRRGRWLWIASNEIPRITNRRRMTPELYRKNGFEQKIGPLVLVRGVNGAPLLVVRNVSVSEAGKSRSARSLTKTGRLRRGQRAKDFVVAFIGIPNTSRAARIDARSIMIQAAADLPGLFNQAISRKEIRRG